MGLFKIIRDSIHTTCKKSRDNTIPTQPYKDGKYKVTKHGVDRMKERQITKGEVHVNLHTTPIEKTKIKHDQQGRPYYERYAKNKIYTAVNPKNKNVATIRRYSTKKINKLKKETK